jgi:nucleotide-binding universal stress UspA family protein
MIKRILVAIDSSVASVAAIASASRLASQLNGELLIVHVLDAVSYLRAQGIERFQPTLDDMQEAGRALLRQACLRMPRKIPVTTQLLTGDPPEMIVGAAVAERADLIVMGTDSRGRLAHFLLGSCADTVIRYAPCPVLTVRADREPRRTGDKRVTAGAFN